MSKWNGTDRVVPEFERDDDHESRSDFERDADRVLYTSALRRLNGVTQVISPSDSYVHHDRLTHSLKVAQVGQAIARALGNPISVDVVHAAALSHDLGHPPFGHAAEAELMSILDGHTTRDGDQIREPDPSENEDGLEAPTSPRRASPGPLLADSFEGNAQTFRIVARVAARKFSERDNGLNLTYRTLAAIQKYPWLRGGEPDQYAGLHNLKWGAFQSESEELKRALVATEGAGLMGPYRSVEADIMDWADDVSYAVHDTEDFFRAGLMPLDVLKSNDLIWGEFLEYARQAIASRRVQDWTVDDRTFEAIAEAVRDRFPSRPYAGDFSSREDLHLFGSDSIRALLHGLFIGDDGALQISVAQRTRVELLKKLTRFYVIDRPDLLLAQRGQRQLVRELFFALYDMAVESQRKTDHRHGLPPRFGDYCELAMRGTDNDGYSTTEERLRRATVDFICSLTDGQATKMAATLSGRRHSDQTGLASL